MRVVASCDSWVQPKDCSQIPQAPTLSGDLPQFLDSYVFCCNTQASSEWKKTQTQIVFITPVERLPLSKTTFFSCHVETPWIPGAGHGLHHYQNKDPPVPSFTIRIGFWLFQLNRVRKIFCIFSAVNIPYSVAPLEASQERDSPLLLLFLTSPASLINDCSAQLQRPRPTSEGSMPGLEHPQNSIQGEEAFVGGGVSSHRAGGNLVNSR